MPLDDEMTPDDAKAEKKRLKDEKKKRKSGNLFHLIIE